MQDADHEDRSRKEKEREKKERQEASIREREKEVQRVLGDTLRERDKEREQHKREEAMQQFKALLVDLVSGCQSLVLICHSFTACIITWISLYFYHRKEPESIVIDVILLSTYVNLSGALFSCYSKILTRWQIA